VRAPDPDGYRALVATRCVVKDGAMGTQIQAGGLTSADYGGYDGNVDHLSLAKPDFISDIHRCYLDAGADYLITNSFQSTRIRLAEWGLADTTFEQNRAAAAIARRVADEFATPSRRRFVAGSVGPTGMLPSGNDPALSAIDYPQLVALFCEQVRGLLAGGIDLVQVETMQDILETRAAITGCRRAFADTGRAVPVQVTVALDVTGKMLLGTDIAAVATILRGMRADVIGANCSVGPDHLREPMRYLCDECDLPVAVIPNAGLPLNVDGETVYPLGASQMAEQMAAFVHDFGVNVIGGCCGTTPQHTRQMVAALAEITPRRRVGVYAPAVASGMASVALLQDPRPMIVGERVNTQGSRKVKQLVLAEDYDGVLQVARDQVEYGAHCLDVCLALTERGDEASQLAVVTKRLAMGVEAPVIFDTTEVEALQRGLETYPGRAIVNSINMESGRSRIDAYVPLIVEHGAAVIALTIDEAGMAKTRDDKLRVARRICEICCDEFGLARHDLIFDALTFTLATGDAEWVDSAVETIEGIRLIKRDLPGVLTSLGVSNVSFGLSPAARSVLNSVFLHHCVEAGLDLAMVNPTHTMAYMDIDDDARAFADDLVFNRRDDALERFIAHFDSVGGAPLEAVSGAAKYASLPVDERIHQKILHRIRDGVESDIEEALDTRGARANDEAVTVLNDVLLPAMKDVGDRFGRGELILPFVLQSAEVMKTAVAKLEHYLDRIEGQSKGRIVLATVYGDVHDIGKSLVNTILKNNGYTTYDLGRQVPIQVIIDKAIEVQADAIGLSALLVSTSKQMPLAVHELAARGLDYPVLIGGAAINRAFGRRTWFLEDGEPYHGGVFYCHDAFEGLDTCETLRDAASAEALRSARHAEAVAHREQVAQARAARPAVTAATRADLPRASVPTPPFLGARPVADMPLDDVWAGMDLRTLYKSSWGAKNAKGEEFDRLVRDDFEPRRLRLQADGVRDGWLRPRAVYGYFLCAAENETLVIFDATGRDELGRLVFPRQERHDRLAIPDYFRAIDDAERDVVAFQVATVGREAQDYLDELYAAERYADQYFAHGIAIAATEGMAEATHRRIKRELGIGRDQGRRYSWGYPACPDLQHHALVCELLDATAAIGVSLTSAFQLDPEQSTAAIVVHHPSAIYFSTLRSERATV
jgi:5-methyltetrahydrofolate--homocysteine methyltransferase